MQEQTNRQASQNNMPMEQFDSESSDSESSSESSENMEGGKSSSNAKHSQHQQKKSSNKKKKPAQRIQPDDEGDYDDWFKMKSESGTGAEVDSLDDVPPEYRGLVREYFKSLNEGDKK